MTAGLVSKVEKSGRGPGYKAKTKDRGKVNRASRSGRREGELHSRGNGSRRRKLSEVKRR